MFEKLLDLISRLLPFLRATAASTVAQMADTAQRQLRAYVLVSSALMKFPTPNVPEAQVHLRNFGQTPAYDLEGWIGMYIGDFPLRTALPQAPPNLRKGKEPLAPGRVSIHVVPRDPPVPPQLLPLLGTVDGTIWAYGEITYKDAFANVRHTRFRLMYGGPGGARPIKGPEGAITGYLMTADTEGNEAD